MDKTNLPTTTWSLPKKWTGLRTWSMWTASSTFTSISSWTMPVISSLQYVLLRVFVTLVTCLAMLVLCSALLLRLLWQLLSWVVPNFMAFLLSSLSYTLTWILWVVQLARWDLLLYKLISLIVTPAGFWHISGVLCAPIQHALRPLVRAITVTLWTGQAVAETQLRCVQWSASNLKDLTLKFVTPAGFWHQSDLFWADDPNGKEEWNRDSLLYDSPLPNQENTSDSHRKPPIDLWEDENHMSKSDLELWDDEAASEDELDLSSWLRPKRESLKQTQQLFKDQDDCQLDVNKENWSHLDFYLENEKKCSEKTKPGWSPPDWMKEDREKHREILRQYNTRMAFFKYLPFRALSRLIGWLSQQEIPWLLRYPGIQLFVWLYHCQLDETIEPSLSKYTTLSEFFQRKLKPGVRPIDPTSNLTSPADGRVLHCGTVKDGVLEQVKGLTYSMKGFLGPPEGLVKSPWIIGDAEICSDKEYCDILLSSPENELFYSIIYLAPGDYHRFHSPADWTVHSRRHISNIFGQKGKSFFPHWAIVFCFIVLVLSQGGQSGQYIVSGGDSDGRS